MKLIRRVTLEDVEAKHTKLDERLGDKPVVFGYLNREWLALKAAFREGDELWECTNGPEAFRALQGASGYALVRGEFILRTIITRKS